MTKENTVATIDDPRGAVGDVVDDGHSALYAERVVVEVTRF